MSAPEHQSGWSYAIILGGLAIVCLLVWLLGKIVTHLFPSTRTRHGSIGNALMGIEATFLPGRDKVLEARQHEAKQEDEEGDPPVAGEK